MIDRLAQLEKEGGYVVGAAERLRTKLGLPERTTEASVKFIEECRAKVVIGNQELLDEVRKVVSMPKGGKR